MSGKCRLVTGFLLVAAVVWWFCRWVGGVVVVGLRCWGGVVVGSRRRGGVVVGSRRRGGVVVG